MSFNVVIGYAGLGDASVERELLAAVGATIVQFGDFDTPEALAAARQADAIMVTIQKIPADLIANLERCRVISRAGTGLDAIDIPAATARGIWVAYVPDYAVDEVSSHAIGLLLAHARGIPWLVESTRSGAWSHQVIAPRRRLRGQTLGLLGFGRIGRAVAAKARGLGLEIIVHDPFLPEQAIADGGARPVDRETLLQESDYLSLHVPLTDANMRFLDAQALALMKPTAFVINTARGGLIDEEALLNAVRAGQIAGAALDVTDPEPLPRGHVLLEAPNVLVVPHIASATFATREAMADMAVDNLLAALRGERMPHIANPEVYGD